MLIEASDSEGAAFLSVVASLAAPSEDLLNLAAKFRAALAAQRKLVRPRFYP